VGGMRGRIGLSFLVALVLGASTAPAVSAATTTIGFDDLASGTSIGEQFAALGVHFGPSPFPGQSGGLTADARPQARSDPNVAAFAYSLQTDFSSSWIKFDHPQSQVSFYACRTGGAGDPPNPNVDVNAYDANGNSLGSQSVACVLNGPLVPVTVQALGIAYINVTGTGGAAAPGAGWGLDDLTFDANPPPPVSLTAPSVYWSLFRGGFICNPGAWANLPPNPTFTYEWLRHGPGARQRVLTTTVATTQLYNSNGSQSLFACRVTARNASGVTTATSSFRHLVPLAVPTFPLGNVRVRGIDVFQVVQPNSGAQTYGYQPNAPTTAFPSLRGGGTPNNYLGFGRIDGNHQFASYLGVPVDADHVTTVVVYVSATEGLASATQPFDVTLQAQYRGRQIGNLTLTRRITNPPVSTSPWVTAAERANVLDGVQFQIPAIWLQVPATLGGTLDLVAHVGLPVGTSRLISQCAPGRDCISDDTYRLNAVPAQHVTPLNVRSVELIGAGQNPNGGITAPDQVFAGVRKVYPGAENLETPPYSAWLGVVNQEAFTATPVGPNQGERAPVFVCNNVRYASSAAATQTLSNATRSCRSSAIGAVVAQWEAANPGSGYDLTAMIHNYQFTPGGGIEPGWTATGSNGTLATSQPSPGNYVRPLILINDGSANRPLTAAAHEFGHAIGFPHAEQFPYANKAKGDCGGSTGGQVGETWPPDNEGQLQGIKFDQTRVAFGRIKDITPFVDGQGVTLYDLMSYCAPNAPETTTWLSARNWNRAFRTLADYETRVAAAAADRASSAAASGPAFAVGVVGSSGGRIVRIVQPHGPEAIPAPVPASPLHLMAFDAAGHQLENIGVAIQGVTFAGAPAAGGTFVGPVPRGAAAVELVRDGSMLDRKARNRPPSVRLLAPTRRTRTRVGGRLTVRWSASDPDADPLNATVDYSSDGGRSWSTVFDGQSTGSATVPNSFLARSRRARIRLFVNDGFNEAEALSAPFTAAGTVPVATIVSPRAAQAARAGEPTQLIGGAFDDRHQRLRGRALTWFAGSRRLGNGERLSATLPAGRITLRLLARDQTGRTGTARLALRVAPVPVRLLALSYPEDVSHRSRTVTVRAAVATAAVLHIGGRSLRVGHRARRLSVPLPRRPASGLIRLPFTVTAPGHSPVKGTVMLVRS
jgi:hypothetical protein